MPRPPVGPKVSIRLPADTRSRLDDIAAERVRRRFRPADCSIAAVARDLIAYASDRHPDLADILAEPRAGETT